MALSGAKDIDYNPIDYDRAEMVHTTTVRGYAKVPVRVSAG
jgi:hypothetical protein